MFRVETPARPAVSACDTARGGAGIDTTQISYFNVLGKLFQ